MKTDLLVPQTLREAIVYYANPKTCHDLLLKLRFPNGVCCVHCGDIEHVKFLEPVQRYKCYSCNKQFSLKSGTVMESSPIPLTKWLPAFWLITNAKNGISSCELARSLGVTQKSAWFMLHRIRHVMATGTFQKIMGVAEADETYIGGKEQNKHLSKRVKAGGGTVGKQPVVGILERGADGKPSQAHMRHTPKITKNILSNVLDDHIHPGSVLYTDAYKMYRLVVENYQHEFVDHAYSYVSGNVHTNGLENFFSLLKRTIRGTYVSIEPFHLKRYLDEQVYRFNNRHETDAERFLGALASVMGKRLKYEELITSYNSYYDQVFVLTGRAARTARNRQG